MGFGFAWTRFICTFAKKLLSDAFTDACQLHLMPQEKRTAVYDRIANRRVESVSCSPALWKKEAAETQWEYLLYMLLNRRQKVLQFVGLAKKSQSTISKAFLYHAIHGIG